jgi:hypothetical protein
MQAIADRDFYKVLGATLADAGPDRIERVVVGLNWTLVVGPHGTGLAHTPLRGTAGCYSLAEAGTFQGGQLADLGALSNSQDVFEQALGFAAINAHLNRYDLRGEALNGLDLVEDRGQRTVIVGRFPSLARRLPGAAVIERDPGPEDYGEEEAARLLPEAEQLIITASAITNGTLPNLLRLAAQAFTVLVGPSTPLTPRLFDFGIDALSGFVIEDEAAAIRMVEEGGSVSALRRHGRFVTLRRSGSNPP